MTGPPLLYPCAACISSGEEAIMPPMPRSLFLASLGIVFSLSAEQAGLRQAIGANTKAHDLRCGARGRSRALLLLNNRAGSRRRTLENVRKEAKGLIRGHGVLILVLTCAVEVCLLLRLLLLTHGGCGVDVLQLLALQLLAEARHLRTQCTEAL